MKHTLPLFVFFAFLTNTCFGFSFGKGKLSDAKAKEVIQDYLKKNPASINVPAKFPASFNLNDYQVKQLEALAAAGILEKKEVELKARGFAAIIGNSTVPGVEFSLTELGEKLKVAEDKGSGGFGKSTQFKYADRELIKIEDKTSPEKIGEHTMSRVSFTYKLNNPVAEVVSSEEVVSFYKFIKDQLNGEQKDKAVLIKTDEGWVHEKMLGR